jgi:hypothetical protein
VRELRAVLRTAPGTSQFVPNFRISRMIGKSARPFSVN